MKPAERPRRFAVDPDAPYDLAHVGRAWRAVTDGTSAGQPRVVNTRSPRPRGACTSTTRRGTACRGTRSSRTLPPDDRRAVLEYLKTL